MVYKSSNKSNIINYHKLPHKQQLDRYFDGQIVYVCDVPLQDKTPSRMKPTSKQTMSWKTQSFWSPSNTVQSTTEEK